MRPGRSTNGFLIPMTAHSLVLTAYDIVAPPRLMAAVIWFDLFGALELSSRGLDLPVWANDNRESWEGPTWPRPQDLGPFQGEQT
jgi:hypothetical protein